jgi:hypothetical protein
MRTLIQSERTLVPPVTAAFADHWRRFTGDRRFVDRGDALDHIAVARDEVAGFNQNHVPGFQIDCGHAVDDVPHATPAIGIDAPFRPRVRTSLA